MSDPTGPDDAEVIPSADDANRALLLELLDTGLDDAPTMAELRRHGVIMPGQALYELELDGYPLERVHRRPVNGHGTGVVAYRLPGQ